MEGLPWLAFSTSVVNFLLVGWSCGTQHAGTIVAAITKEVAGAESIGGLVSCIEDQTEWKSHCKDVQNQNR